MYKPTPRLIWYILLWGLIKESKYQPGCVSSSAQFPDSDSQLSSGDAQEDTRALIKGVGGSPQDLQPRGSSSSRTLPEPLDISRELSHLYVTTAERMFWSPFVRCTTHWGSGLSILSTQSCVRTKTEYVTISFTNGKIVCYRRWGLTHPLVGSLSNLFPPLYHIRRTTGSCC